MSSKGIDDAVKKDVQKFKRIKNEGTGSFDLPTAMEYTFWLFAVLSAGFMIVSMPWVGPDKPISGMMWLAGSIGGVALFGGLAMATRMVPEV